MERFEFYIGGFEVGNAFSELNDPEDQRRRFEAQLVEKARGDEEANDMDEDYVRALSYGLPVIATVNSGGADILSEGSTGFLVPVRSPDAIADKLQLLADSPDLLAEISSRAVMRDNGRRSWENTCQIFIETLEDFRQMPKL